MQKVREHLLVMEVKFDVALIKVDWNRKKNGRKFVWIGLEMRVNTMVVVFCLFKPITTRIMT